MDKTVLEILEKLNGLYANAFNQLVTYTIGLVAFVGLLIPAVITWIQNRSFRRELDAVTKQLHEEASKIREELKESLRDELLKELREGLSRDIAESEKRVTDTLAEKDISLTKKISNADGGVFHVQASLQVYRENYAAALADFAAAASRYLISEDELNLQRVLPQIVSNLAKVAKDDLDASEEIEANVSSLIKSLAAKNINGRYEDLISQIRKALKEAKQRTPSAKSA